MLQEGFTEDDVPELGQYVGLPKCVPVAEECPRVERSLMNEVPAAICMILISRAPWADTLANTMWQSFTARLPAAEKQRAITKIAAAMGSDPVIEYLRRRADQNRSD